MYLVTGATGNVGREVVEQLLASGKKVRVFTRDPGKVARWGERVEVAQGDFQNPDSFTRALSGVTAAFLMNGSPDPTTIGRLAAATTQAKESPRIVFLSTCWASPASLAESPPLQIGRWHQAMENALRESGLRSTFVRPSAFMSNFFQWSGSIKAEGTVYNPMGSGPSAPIASQDIAAVVVRALTDPALAGEAFELTGPALLSVPEQVEILSRVIARPLRCVDIPVEAAVQGLTRAGAPAPLAAAVAESFEAVRAGRAAVLTEAVARLTGHAPLSFEAWARQHAARFT